MYRWKVQVEAQATGQEKAQVKVPENVQVMEFQKNMHVNVSQVPGEDCSSR